MGVPERVGDQSPEAARGLRLGPARLEKEPHARQGLGGKTAFLSRAVGLPSPPLPSPEWKCRRGAWERPLKTRSGPVGRSGTF